MISVTKGSGTSPVANKTVKKNILISIRIALGIHRLGNYICREFCLRTILKLDNVLTSVADGIIVGAAEDFAVRTARAFKDSTFGQAFAAGQVNTNPNVVV